MGTKRVLVCDGCGIEQLHDEAIGWLNVRTMVTHQEELNRLIQKAHLQAEEVGSFDELAAKGVIDFGDFHSLACLANWASAQANLHSLDEPPLPPTDAATDEPFFFGDRGEDPHRRGSIGLDGDD